MGGIAGGYQAHFQRERERKVRERERLEREALQTDAAFQALLADIKGLPWGRCDYGQCSRPVAQNYDAMFCAWHSDDEA